MRLELQEASETSWMRCCNGGDLESMILKEAGLAQPSKLSPHILWTKGNVRWKCCLLMFPVICLHKRFGDYLLSLALSPYCRVCNANGNRRGEWFQLTKELISTNIHTAFIPGSDEKQTRYIIKHRIRRPLGSFGHSCAYMRMAPNRAIPALAAPRGELMRDIWHDGCKRIVVLQWRWRWIILR